MNDATPVRHRWIAHVDLDAFYASCEQRDHPEYRGRPVVVGARPGHRGVVAAASYEAREFGIHSAMPIAQAVRRCPDAVYVRPDMAKYQESSRQVFAVLDTITPVVEKASIDEAYLDVTGLDRIFGSPQDIGRTIRERIKDATQLTASVGIGPNRLIAKLGSESNKPDGLTVITPEQALDFLAPMPVSNLRGLGRKTLPTLNRLRIRTIADLRDWPLDALERHLGARAAASFYRQARGEASDEVVPGRQRKSISKETTFGTDVTDQDRLRDVLRELSAEVARTARREGLAGRVITLKIRFAGFETHTRQKSVPRPTDDERVLHTTGGELLNDSSLPNRPVRLIGIGLSGWSQTDDAQSDLFADDVPAGPDPKVLEAIDAATEKFGKPLLQVGLSRKPRS